MKSQTKSCRFCGEVAKRIEKAASEQELLQSEVFRRAVRHYVESNPDDISAFSKRNNSANLDETENRANESSSDSKLDSSLSGGTYDPTREGL